MKELAETEYYRGNRRERNRKQGEVIKDISKQFRAILSEQVLLLREFKPEQQEIEYSSTIQLYEIAILIWHFAEIFILNSSYEELEEEDTSVDLEGEEEEAFVLKEDLKNRERRKKKIKKHKIILSLIEWVSLYWSGDTSVDSFSEILQERQPEKNPSYWNLISRFG